MLALFVSDMHLSAERPAMVEAFLDFLQGPARQADALYILGDMFDEWLGDDDLRPPHPAVEAGIAALAGRGVAVHVMHGNHDFLLGREFAERSGARLLEEPARVHLFGTDAVLLHGDILCTRDVSYQQFRRYARDPRNQSLFLQQSLAEREAEAAKLRHRSTTLTRLKPLDIMDVSQDAVEGLLLDQQASLMIHGHTHRPGVHHFPCQNGTATRAVLGDWYEQDSLLIWDQDGLRPVRVREL